MAPEQDMLGLHIIVWRTLDNDSFDITLRATRTLMHGRPALRASSRLFSLRIDLPKLVGQVVINGPLDKLHYALLDRRRTHHRLNRLAQENSST